MMLLLAAVVTSRLRGVPLRLFVQDPVASANLHPLTGVISNVGILVWAAAAGVALLAGHVLRKRGGGRAAYYLLCLGAATAFVAADDLFLLHSEFLAGATQAVKGITATFYLSGLVGLSVYFRREILATPYPLLMLAAGFFAASLGMDSIEPQLMRLIGEWQIFSEDAAKLLGIFAWAAYLFFSASDALENTRDDASVQHST